MPPSLTQLRCHAQCTPASPAPDLTPKTTSCEKLAASTSVSQARMGKPPGEYLPVLTTQGPSVCSSEQLTHYKKGEPPAAAGPTRREPEEKGACVLGHKVSLYPLRGVHPHFLLSPLGDSHQMAGGTFMND